MALAMSRAAPLRPDIKLSQALKEYEAILTEDQKRSFHDTSPLESKDVMALTFEINRKNAGRKSRVWGARLTTFLGSVKSFTAVVDVIITNAGNPIAGAVWGAVKMAMQAASGFESYFDALSTMLMNVGLSAPRYEKYVLLYPTSASLRRELCNYFSVVINLCKSAVVFVQKPLVSQALSVLRKPFDDEFGLFKKDLLQFGESVKDEVSLAAKQQQNLDSIEEARERKENSLFRRTGALFQQEAAHQLKESKRVRELRFKSRFLKSCSTYNHETALNQARRKGASNWIFNTKEYKEWKFSNSSSTLLCSGIVGAGKTILSSSVIEDLVVTKSANSSVAYFFCKDDDLESLKAREIMRSLARQFLSSIPAKLFNNLDQVNGSIALDCDQITSYMIRLLPPNIQYVIVLDGLDECTDKESHRVFDTLQSLLKLPTHLFRLFWTGRSDFVERVFRRLQSNYHVRISQSNNGPEISRFIESALDAALGDGRLQLRDPHIIVKIQDVLEIEAHEMFLWVTFQIDSICRENTDEGILNSLKDLPKDLPTTYRRILRRLRDSESTDPLIGKKIFEIASVARRPFTLEELREAISIEPGNTTWSTAKLVNDMMKSLDCCGSLLVIDEELSTIHFAHSSVKQHLEAIPNELDIPEYHVVPRTANLELGKRIVTYLNLDVWQKQLTNARKPPQTSATQHASALLRASLPQSDLANTFARKILKNRKIPGYDLGRDLEKVAEFTWAPKVQPRQANSLFSYAQEHWLSHTGSFDSLIYSDCYRLWTHLIEGRTRTVELLWTSQDALSLNAKFLDSVAKSNNSALIEYAVYLIVKSKWKSHIEGMQMLLELLPGRLDTSHEKFNTYSEALLRAVSEGNDTVVQLLVDKTPANANAQYSVDDTVLNMALRRGNLASVNTLIEHGANVNAAGSLWGSVMGTAARCPIGEQAIPLLLEAGAEEISIDALHSNEEQEMLRRCYHVHRERLRGLGRVTDS